MGTGYTRNDTPNNIADGNVINASDLDGEFDAVQAAFNGSTGHSHDGTTGEGPQIATAGLADNAVTTAKITDANVTTAKINNGAVTSAKLDTNIQIAGTLGVTGETTLTTHLNMGDNDIIKLGASADLQIYHSGSNSIIDDLGTGNLLIRSDGTAISLQVNSKNSVRAVADEDVELYYNGNQKLATTSTGIDVTGVITTDGMTTSADINFGDNDKAVFGAGSDLQIYHDGANSRIDDAGSGRLIIRGNGGVSLEKYTGETLAIFNSDGASSLYYDNSEKLATTNTGIDVTGTATMDGLTSSVSRTSGANATAITLSDNVTGVQTGGFGTRIVGQSNGTSAKSAIGFEADIGNNNDTAISFYTQSSGINPLLRRLKIARNGDINLGYEDTGTTPKLFWDASNESLGIGTTSPAYQIDIQGSSNNAFRLKTSSPIFRMEDSDDNAHHTLIASSDDFYINADVGNTGAGNMIFRNGGTTERMRIDSSGNVGIGTSSPRAPLHIYPSGNASDDFNLLVSQFRPNIVLEDLSTNATDYQLFVDGDDLQFRYGDASTDTKLANEAMRIDSSGNLLVGTTTTDNSDTGVELRYTGLLQATTSNALPLRLNRLSTDGTILEFQKDTSTVGSIGSNSGQPYFINSSNKGIRLYTSGIAAAGSAGAFDDNAQDLGASSVRWDDIYATNGTIQTSDQNEKNTITDSDLGIDFIKRLTPKSYIFNGKTRTHYGLIAQDVETVLGDISKPTSEFAGFIKTDISEEQDGSEYRYGLRYTEFVAPLIQAVKDQQATIDALTARITALENGV